MERKDFRLLQYIKTSFFFKNHQMNQMNSFRYVFSSFNNFMNFIYFNAYLSSKVAGQTYQNRLLKALILNETKIKYIPIIL